jgi:hypothetical protein
MNPARIGYAMRCDIFDALPYIHAGAGMRGAADKSHHALTRSTQFGAFQHVLAAVSPHLRFEIGDLRGGGL